MSGYCSFCGRNKPPYEKHHLAGEINHHYWTIRACIGCHSILTAWQWTRRTPRNKEYEPPEEIRLQAIYEGLSTAYEVACEYTGHTPASIAAGSIITHLLKHDPDPMTGKDFSLDGNYPKLKVKNPVRVPVAMCGENFHKTVAAMCSMMAYLVEGGKGKSDELAVLLRELEKRDPVTLPRVLPKADFLAALATCDEGIIRDKLAKFASEMGVQV